MEPIIYVDKYVNEFVEQSLMFAKGQNITLKNLYTEYKKYIVVICGMEPLLYKHFRTSLEYILQQQNGPSQIKNIRSRWYVTNVAIVSKFSKKFVQYN